MKKFTFYYKSQKNSTLSNTFFTFSNFNTAWKAAIDFFKKEGSYGVYIGDEDGNVIWACDGEGARNFVCGKK